MKKEMMKAAAVAAAALVLTGCGTATKVVEVPQTYVVRDTVSRGAAERLTLVVRDSVTVRGDTVERERLVWRERTVHDTVYAVRARERSEALPVVVEAASESRASKADRAVAAALLGSLATMLIYSRLRRR